MTATQLRFHITVHYCDHLVDGGSPRVMRRLGSLVSKYAMLTGQTVTGAWIALRGDALIFAE